MISSSGYLTELAMRLNPKKYHSIHKIFSREKIDYVGIQIKIIVMILKTFKIKEVSISIDDSIIYRSRKKKVPYGQKQFDHANKANRSQYVFGQKWLALGLTFSIKDRRITLPLYIHLVKPKTNLISVTIMLIMKVHNVIKKEGLSIKVELLTDSWFARQRLILRANNRYNFSVITMARKDLALYKKPEIIVPKPRGRPKKYGDKITPKIEDLTEEIRLEIYAREVTIKYKEEVVKARFLNGEIVKAVWLKFEESQSMRLLISTDIELSAIEIIKRYEKRWDIESMFNELKNNFRFKDIMMHNKKSYYQFLYFKLWCYIILKLTATQYEDKIRNYIRTHLPWRVVSKKEVRITAGSAKLALKTIFWSLDIRTFFPKVDNTIEVKKRSAFFREIQEEKLFKMTG